MVFVNDADATEPGASGEFSFDNGFGLFAALGSSLEGGGRLEAELGYRANDIDTISLDGVGTFDVGGDVTIVSFMGNGYYDLRTSGSFTPFIGGGLGFANVEGDIEGLGSEDDTVFAYQLMLGGSFATSETLNIDLQYRFFGTSNPDFEGTEVEYTTHNLMIGLRSKF